MADKPMTTGELEALCRKLSADPAIDEMLANVAKSSDKKAAKMAEAAQARRADLRAKGHLKPQKVS